MADGLHSGCSGSQQAGAGPGHDLALDPLLEDIQLGILQEGQERMGLGGGEGMGILQGGQEGEGVSVVVVRGEGRPSGGEEDESVFLGSRVGDPHEALMFGTPTEVQGLSKLAPFPSTCLGSKA